MNIKNFLQERFSVKLYKSNCDFLVLSRVHILTALFGYYKPGMEKYKMINRAGNSVIIHESFTVADNRNFEKKIEQTYSFQTEDIISHFNYCLNDNKRLKWKIITNWFIITNIPIALSVILSFVIFASSIGG